MKRTTTICLLAMAAAAMLFAPAAAAAPPTTAIVGDSITYLSEPAIATALTGQNYQVAAIEGKRIGDMMPYAVAFAGAHNMVINLGTNDAIGSDRHWLTAWQTLMADTASAPCLILFTVSEETAIWQPTIPIAKRLDSRINALRQAEPGRIRVIDWNAAVRASLAGEGINPDGGITVLQQLNALEAGGPKGLVVQDAIHPTAVGSTWIANAIAAELRTCPA
jgi:hypothetical protein